MLYEVKPFIDQIMKCQQMGILSDCVLSYFQLLNALWIKIFQAQHFLCQNVAICFFLHLIEREKEHTDIPCL